MDKTKKEKKLNFLRCQRGSVLIEFAMISLVFYLLAAGTLTFGQLFISAQSIQDIARVTARELALTPLPADLTFEEALYASPEDYDPADPKRAAVESLRTRLFDEEWLVIDLESDLGALTLDELFATLPIVNQAMRSLMIFDQAEGKRLLRYPGALEVAATRTGYRVRLPVVTARSEEGIETLEFVPVFEEIEDPLANPNPFLAGNGGMVALRVNYPYQSASMSGFMKKDQGVFDPNMSNRITADDDAVGAAGNFVEAGIEVEPGVLAGPYAGRYGLGVQKAFAQDVRPFRKFLSAQSFFRREVFA